MTMYLHWVVTNKNKRGELHFFCVIGQTVLLLCIERGKTHEKKLIYIAFTYNIQLILSKITHHLLKLLAKTIGDHSGVSTQIKLGRQK